MKSIIKFSTLFLVLLFTVFSCKPEQKNETESKWFKSGSSPNDYSMGGNPFSTNDEDAGFVKSNVENPDKFGTWMTKIKPGNYLGKRVKMSFSLKTVNVEKSASMWMRVDGKVKRSLSFDNMMNRALKSTNDWKAYSIVLDVPDSSAGIFYGVMLSGKGIIWAKNLVLEIVDGSVELTDIRQGMNYLSSGNYKKAISFIEKTMQDKLIDDNTLKYYSLWYYIALIETDQKEKAEKFISSFIEVQKKDEWTTKIALFLTDKITEEDLLKASNNEDVKVDKGQKCEAYFYIGLFHKYNQDLINAKLNFEKSISYGVEDFVEYDLAQVELSRI